MIKRFIYIVILFVLIYFENIELIGGIKLGYLWKILIIIFSIIEFSIPKNDNLIKAYLAFVFVSLFTVFTDLTVASIASISKILWFYAIYILAKNSTAKNNLKLFYILSTFLLVSGIPVMLGILPSVETDSANLSEWGGADLNVFTGIFQGSHPAGISAAIAVIAYIAFYEKDILKHRYLGLFLIFLNIYFTYLSFNRTAWFILLNGIIFLFLFKKTKLQKKKIIYKYLVIIAVLLLSNYAFNNVKPIQNRILDVRDDKTYNNRAYDERIGSGRLSVYKAAIDVFKEMNIVEKTIGVGEQEYIKRMGLKLGMGLFAHNGFLNILLKNGLLGLFFYLIFLIYCLRMSFTSKSDFRNLKISYVLAFIIFLLTQGGNLYTLETFLAISLNLEKIKK
ncbi:MAG: hypothetical protein CVU09_03090 [Bacteroidetes bacterium HGW-Bacteroidetes-4]|nr:MAG: hypothetical protein CVU09_03090 [Bacteroidetes bacterium HGW-Bacteroidetes-4]